jgi:hypothetical protein
MATGTMTVAQAQATFSAINPAFVVSIAQNGIVSAGNVGYLYRLQVGKTGQNPLGVDTMDGTQDVATAAKVAAATPTVAAMPAKAAAATATPTAAPVATTTPHHHTPGRANRPQAGSTSSSGGGGWSGRRSAPGRTRGGGWQGPQPLQQPVVQQTYIPGFSVLTPQEAAQIQAGQNIANQQVGLGYYAGLGQPRRTPGRANRPTSGGSSRSSGWGGSGSGSYNAGYPSGYSGWGGAQPVTTTDQGTTLTQEGYLEQLQALGVSAATTATSTAASVDTVPVTSAVNPSWFTEQTIVAGVPNWAFLAGGGVLLFMFMRRR